MAEEHDVSREMTEPKWVFIVDEHAVHDPESGQYLFDVTKDDLEKAAANGNKRIEESGDYTPITLGHTLDDLPEHKQPPIVGYAGPFVVEPFFDTGRHAIKAAMRYFKEHEEVPRKYPRRSVEVTWTDHLIDPIAVLGATTPARNMGLSYSRRKKCEHCARRYCACQHRKYQEGGDGQPSDLADMKGEILSELKESAPWKLMEQMAQEREAQEAAEKPETGPEGGPGEEPPVTPKPPPGPPPRPMPPPPMPPPPPAGMAPPAAAPPPAPPVPPGEDIYTPEEPENPMTPKPPTRMAATSSPGATNVDPAMPHEAEANMPGPQLPEDLRSEHMQQARYWHKLGEKALQTGDQNRYSHCMAYAKHHMKYAMEDRLENNELKNPPAGHGPAVDHGMENLHGSGGGKGAASPPSKSHYAHEAPLVAAAEPAEAEDPREMNPEKLRMQRDQSRSLLLRYKHGYETAQADLRETKLKLQRVERERDLIQLESEGIDFDRAEELDYVAPMEEAAYQAHLTRMKTRYSKAPVNGRRIFTNSNPHLPVPKRPDAPAQGAGDKNSTQAAIKLATEKGWHGEDGFRRAYAEVTAGGNGNGKQRTV